MVDELRIQCGHCNKIVKTCERNLPKGKAAYFKTSKTKFNTIYNLAWDHQPNAGPQICLWHWNSFTAEVPKVEPDLNLLKFCIFSIHTVCNVEFQHWTHWNSCACKSIIWDNSILLRNLALLCRDRLLVCVYELTLKTSIHRYNDLKGCTPCRDSKLLLKCTSCFAAWHVYGYH